MGSFTFKANQDQIQYISNIANLLAAFFFLIAALVPFLKEGAAPYKKNSKMKRH